MNLPPALLIRTTGEEVPVTPANGTDFLLDEVRDLLGCQWVELVPLRNLGKILLCDEEGSFNGQMPNHAATIRLALAEVLTPAKGYHGHVLVCDTTMFR